MDSVQSLARGLQILDFAIERGGSISITEIAAALEVNKSSASRLVKTLVQGGYLQQQPGTRRFVVGQKLIRLGWQMTDTLALREKAHPLLENLVRITGECSHVAVYTEGRALVIDDVETDNTLRVAGQTGRRLPMHCTALGKGFLAFGDFSMPQTMERYTPETFTDPQSLRDHLVEVRKRGYAMDDEEYDEGIRCIAAPVYDSSSRLIAMVGISGPAVRMTYTCIREFSVSVRAAADQLSNELGYFPQETSAFPSDDEDEM